MTRNSKTFGALLFVALCGVSIATTASAQNRQEVREDRKEKREDRKELREDKKELREDVKDGASRKEIHDDKKEIADDKKELREDRKETREDRQDLRKSRRRELHEKWGDIVKKPEGKEELRVHGRRMSRLTRARAVAQAANKTELVARIDKLIEKEKTRHQGKMDHLREASAGAAK